MGSAVVTQTHSRDATTYAFSQEFVNIRRFDNK